jgi:D-serine deaminase-like pyridoxal phosphate-dependent protein
MTTLIQDLDTPALLVDSARLESNLSSMQAVADKAEVDLRPHIKTHKCLEIARRQLALGANGLTCAKISEAEVMAEVCEDLFIAYPILGEIKWKRLDALAGRVHTRISVESLEGARLLNEHLEKVGRIQEVLVKVETGLQRTGVEPEELGSFLEELLRLRQIQPVGLFTHEGKAYKLHGETEIRPLLDNLAKTLREMAAVFETTIGEVPLLSPGCTITAPLVTGEEGFSEIRPGTYAFTDAFCESTGIYRPENWALTVLVRVVAVKPDGRVVVDGGSKTFAMDRHPDLGHGRVPGHPDLFFDRLSEEHGVLLTEDPEPYRVGDFLEIVPAHVCPVVNLHTRLHLREGDQVVGEWRVDARGCVT